MKGKAEDEVFVNKALIPEIIGDRVQITVILKVKKDEDERRIDFGSRFHRIIPPPTFSPSSNWFMMPMQMRMMTMRTSEMAEPRFGLYAEPRNCISMRSPMSRFPPPPSILEIINVETAGTNTMVTPEMTPGMLMGRTTLRKTLRLFAPRSCAASMTLLSILVSTE